MTINNTHKVSVIIPTYNRAHLIARSIESVLNQTYREFELIVVDDGSTDNTEEVVKSFNDQRIRYIRYQMNEGAATARNTGIRAARGDYIAFQDSDDEWHPDKLEKQINILLNYKEEMVIYTDMERIYQNGEAVYWKSPTINSFELIDERTIDYKPMGIGITTVVLKRSCFETVGLFDEKLPRFIDLDFLIRLSKVFRFYHMKEALVKYYFNEGISTNSHSLVMARKRLIEKYCLELQKNKSHLARQYLLTGIALGRDSNLSESKKYFIEAFKKDPLNHWLLYIILLSSFNLRLYKTVFGLIWRPHYN